MRPPSRCDRAGQIKHKAGRERQRRHKARHAGPQTPTSEPLSNAATTDTVYRCVRALAPTHACAAVWDTHNGGQGDCQFSKTHANLPFYADTTGIRLTLSWRSTRVCKSLRPSYHITIQSWCRMRQHRRRRKKADKPFATKRGRPAAQRNGMYSIMTPAANKRGVCWCMLMLCLACGWMIFCCFVTVLAFQTDMGRAHTGCCWRANEINLSQKKDNRARHG